MKCTIIKNKAILIEGLFSEEKLSSLVNKIPSIRFHEKFEPGRYACYVEHFSPQQFGVEEEFLRIGKFLERIYGKRYSLNQGMELIRMRKGDFLDTHTDQHNTVQGVLYLSDIKNMKGGCFKLETHPIYPNLGDIILFPGFVEHSVEEIFSESNRYSLSFGFIA